MTKKIASYLVKEFILIKPDRNNAENCKLSARHFDNGVVSLNEFVEACEISFYHLYHARLLKIALKLQHKICLDYCYKFQAHDYDFVFFVVFHRFPTSWLTNFLPVFVRVLRDRP